MNRKKTKTSASLTFFVLAILLPSISSAQEWQLVWSDEFQGNAIDTGKWEFMIGDGTNYGLPSGWGNNELQYYRKENAAIENDALVITAAKENYMGKEYTSARLRTVGKGDWKYGRFEFRAKMPTGKGLWSAIWLLPTDNVYGGWAASGEIDIVEHVGHETNTVLGTLHYGGSWPQNTFTGKEYTLSSDSFHDDFHVFALEWQEGLIRWYVDDLLYQTQNNWYSTNGKFPAPFDQRFHLLINLAVGGNLPGAPNGTTSFPQKLYIDYVRIYQQAETSVGHRDGHPPVGFSLGQNYPNPFNPQTTIQYSLADEAHVSLEIFDANGRSVAVLIDQQQNPGVHTALYMPGARHSGMYLYRLNAGVFEDVKSMLYIK